MAKKRNPIACALRSPHLRSKVITPKTVYNRKKENRQGDPSGGSSIF